MDERSRLLLEKLANIRRLNRELLAQLTPGTVKHLIDGGLSPETLAEIMRVLLGIQSDPWVKRCEAAFAAAVREWSSRVDVSALSEAEYEDAVAAIAIRVAEQNPRPRQP
jgi:hypothetical protein